jgi:hypothetical protein
LGSITARTTGNVIPKRSVFLEDQTRSIVELTLWYDDAKNAATLFKVPLLCQPTGMRHRALTRRGGRRRQNGDVLAVTGAWVNRFRGHTTLSTKHASYKLHVNSALPQTAALVQWCVHDTHNTRTS